MRPKEIPEAAGASYFNLGEDAHLMMKSNDAIPTGTREDFSKNVQKPDCHPREKSAGTRLGFPVFLSSSGSKNKIRRRYFTLFPKTNRLVVRNSDWGLSCCSMPSSIFSCLCDLKYNNILSTTV
jgi:hypothetical protein